MATDIGVCIVQPGLDRLSETFLRAHAERLPARVTVVHGLEAHIDGRPVLSQSLAGRAWRKAGRLLRGRSYDQEAIDSFVAAFRLARAQVVLAEFGPMGVCALPACRRLALPLVVHFHGFDASERAVLERHREDYPRLFAQAAAIVVVSEAMRERLLSLGAPAEKLHYNPYGVDLRRFEASDPGAAPPVFLAVGRFTDKKAPQLTILAFERVLRRRPEALLRMVGDGPLRGACRDLARALGIEKSIAFLGARSHAEVSREMSGARCFVQHSIEAANGDCEGMPNSVIEAGACGLPVIATRHAGIPDVVIHGETGLLVAEHDVEAMAVQMERIAGDPALARGLGLAARRRIESGFSLDQSIEGLWAIVSSCIGPRAV